MDTEITGTGARKEGITQRSRFNFKNCSVIARGTGLSESFFGLKAFHATCPCIVQGFLIFLETQRKARVLTLAYFATVVRSTFSSPYDFSRKSDFSFLFPQTPFLPSEEVFCSPPRFSLPNTERDFFGGQPASDDLSLHSANDKEAPTDRETKNLEKRLFLFRIPLGAIAEFPLIQTLRLWKIARNKKAAEPGSDRGKRLNLGSIYFHPSGQERIYCKFA